MEERSFIDETLLIARYLEGNMSRSERAVMERLIAGDAASRQDLQLISRAAASPPIDTPVPRRAIERAIALYHDQRNTVDIAVALITDALKVLSHSAQVTLGGPQLLAALRKGASSPLSHLVVTKEMNRAAVDVHIDRTLRDSCSLTVHVKNTDRSGQLENVRAELLSGWRELASSPLERGVTQFDELKPGRYDLVLRKNEAVLGRMTLRIENE